MQKRLPREWDWLSASLLFLLLQVAAARLVTTDWAPFLYLSETLTALGTMVGLALGASHFGRRAVSVLAASYTVCLFPWQLAEAAADKRFLDRLMHVGGILLVDAGQFLQRQPVKDTLFFVALTGLAFWMISLVAGYALARHGDALPGILLSGVAIVIVQVYANYQSHASWWLAFYLLIAFVLAGRAYYLQTKKEWIKRRVYVNEDAWPSILGSLFTTVAVTILLAWSIPSSPVGLHDAADAWNRFSRPILDRLSNAVSSLNGPYGNRPGINFYGATLAMGQNAATGDSTVFTVKVQADPAATPRYYWRGRVYDTYADGQWSTSPALALVFRPAGGDLSILEAGGRSEARLQFTSQFPTQSLIYAPSQPVWLDRPANLVVDHAQTGFYDETLYDILSWQAQTPVSRGGRYELKAELANPDVQRLRAAGTTYPRPVSDRYLEVPQGIRAKFKGLAESVTSGQANEFDKAAALTNYLRSNLQYSTIVPAPPEDQDPVAWVLFTYKKGFCNYYASAEVLLLRSIGIPARLAVGFAQGEQQNDSYVVRRRDAHAWPEAYFPGTGWVEFEPTDNQAPLARPNGSQQNNLSPFGNRLRQELADEAASAANPGANRNPSEPSPLGQGSLGRNLTGVVFFIAGGLLLYLAARYRIWLYVPIFLSKTMQRSGMPTPVWIDRWLRWNQMQSVERSFTSINVGLLWLGKPQPVDATPAERARQLAALLPAAAGSIETLRLELETGLFTPRPADAARARRASVTILLHLLRARVLRISNALAGRDVYSR